MPNPLPRLPHQRNPGAMALLQKRAIQMGIDPATLPPEPWPGWAQWGDPTQAPPPPWCSMVGLDLLLAADRKLLVAEMNGSNYGLEGYRLITGDKASKHDIYRETWAPKNRPSHMWSVEAQGIVENWMPWPDPFDNIFDDKWESQVLHPPGARIPRARATLAGEVANLLVESDARWFIEKPVSGSCGKGIDILSREEVDIYLYEEHFTDGYVVEPLIEPPLIGGFQQARSMRVGLTLDREVDGPIRICHLASYWRCARRMFDPTDPASVIVNLSKSAYPERLTRQEFNDLHLWLKDWAAHLEELWGKPVEVHMNVDEQGNRKGFEPKRPKPKWVVKETLSDEPLPDGMVEMTVDIEGEAPPEAPVRTYTLSYTTTLPEAETRRPFEPDVYGAGDPSGMAYLEAAQLLVLHGKYDNIHDAYDAHLTKDRKYINPISLMREAFEAASGAMLEQGLLDGIHEEVLREEIAREDEAITERLLHIAAGFNRATSA